MSVSKSADSMYTDVKEPLAEYQPLCVIIFVHYSLEFS